MKKKLISLLLTFALLLNALPLGALADDNKVQYDPVTITLNPSTSLETQFRTWAAQVIDDYYDLYCLQPASSLNDFDFEHSSLTGALASGIYREYYFAGMAKYNYDFGVRSTYTIIRYDKETDEQYAAKMMPFYKLLLIETMEEKYLIDDDEQVDPKKAGLYTLEKGSDGKMHMVLDKSETMQTLEEIATQECEKALSNLCIEIIGEIFSVGGAIDTLKNGAATTDAEKLLNSMKKAVTDSLLQLMRRFANTEFDNKIAALNNYMNMAMVCYIRNKEIVNYDRIINCLDKVYNDKSLTTFRTDPVFRTACDELIQLAKDKKGSVDANAIADWYDESYSNAKILSQEEIMNIVGLELADQICNMLFTMLKDGFDEFISYEKGEDYVSSLGLDVVKCVMEVLKDALKQMVETGINNYKKTGSVYVSGSFDFNAQEATLTALNHMCDVLRDQWKDDMTDINTGDKVLVMSAGIFKGVMSKLDLIEECIATKSFTWNDALEIGKSVLSEVLKSTSMIFKAELKDLAGDEIKGHYRTFQRWTNAISDAWKQTMKTSEALAQTLYASINKWTDEKQTSYKAVMIASSYTASKAIVETLPSQILNIKYDNGGDLKNAILQGNVSCEEILKITDKIKLQLEYDISGTKWLCNLLSAGENNDSFWGNAKFYDYVIKNAKKSTIWQSRMTLERATTEYDLMVSFRDKWESGWTEDFRTLA